MKALIQRVSSANVKVKGDIVGAIDKGILILLGVGKADTSQDVKKLIAKIVGLRVFENEGKPMDLSVKDVEGG
ncbi:D-aminoacyl-tRNA deacylase, partial [Patescibacteria group bacterium]|nr:D-aminoacyl-tRNA deacylase [Patescibacteria group bacterium]